MPRQLTHGIVFLGSIAQASVSMVCLWFVGKVPTWVHENPDTRISERLLWFFGIVTLWWLILVALHVGIMKFYHVPKRGLMLSIGSSISYIGLVLLVETSVSRMLLLILAGVMSVFLWYWGLRPDTGIIDFRSKPWRRVVAMQWVFTMYAIMAMLFAADVFFPSIPWWVLGSMGGFYTGVTSFYVWRLYIEAPRKHFLPWVSIITLIMVELMWVIHLLPIGYLVQALLLVWVWYVVHLFVRFHFTARGIIWGQQRVFLIVNALLYILVLYFARWI